MDINEYLQNTERVLAKSRNHSSIQHCDEAAAIIAAALGSGSPLLLCGNGGSASDAMHIAGELVGRFLKERRALNCICLASNPAILTAWANDYSYDSVFARQVEAHAEEGGVLFGLSTSGNSKNVIAAFNAAHAAKMKTIALTGEGGGALASVSDILIDVPSRLTPLIQQVHICLYHYICEQVEAALAPCA